MKKITSLVVVLLMMISTFTNGQTALTYTNVVLVDSVTSIELYNRAKLWFATMYNSSNDVLQMDNKEEGLLVGKAIMNYSPKVFSGSEQTTGSIRYMIKIFVKDGRYKYEISNFIHDPYGNQYGKASLGLITTDVECPNPRPMAKGWSNKVWLDIKNQIEQNTIPLVASLKQKMVKPIETKKIDW